MKEIDDITEYIKNFDTLTYPTQLYQDLVVDGIESADKLNLMGAWKTGAIRLINKKSTNQPHAVHTDTEGNPYTFTRRWKLEAPVGYATWRKLNDNQEKYKQRIPVEFTNKQPDIVEELVNEKGFGFIWALFVLHCYYPTVYPLYDQHVYRAYKYHESDYQTVSRIAPANWGEYVNYRAYFLNLLAKHNCQYWELDRGLWAFGKTIKSKRMLQEDTFIEPVIQVDLAATLGEEESWVRSQTLGGKAKQFHWRMDSAFNISILRHFKSAKYGPVNYISGSDLSRLVEYVTRMNEVTLSNSVSKLGNKTEKEGIGLFLYETLGWDTTSAQLASHFAALFVEAGIWCWNEQRRGMLFKSVTENWQATLSHHYKSRLSEID